MTTLANPFLQYSPFVAPAADERDVSYALVQTGPAVASEEVESHLDAVEVRIRWGTQVLAVKHLEANTGFAIGEGGDFVLPDVMRTPIVECHGGASYVVIPEGSSATMNDSEVTGSVALSEGTSVTIEMSPVTIEVSGVRAGKKVPMDWWRALATGAAAFIGVSFLGHTAIVAALALFMPAMNPDDAEAIDRDQILTMQAMLNASAEREQEALKEQSESAEESGGGSVGGEPHKGQSGATGTTKPVTTKGHMAFKGSDDHVRLSRKEELELAMNGGLIGILRSGAPATGPASPWATETQLGQDPDNKFGAMFGQSIDDAMGAGGLGLWGTGEGGGGNGLGIGIDGVGSTVGGGGGGPGKWGFGRGDKDGMGNGHGPGAGGHVAKAPIIRNVNVETNGRIPAEVIQRIVRQNFGRFRLCYESGLRNNPGLTGRVVTKFVIGRDGAVAQAQDAGSDIPSQEVVACVVRSFNSLSFPQPQGGVATVTYPIALSPGE